MVTELRLSKINYERSYLCIENMVHCCAAYNCTERYKKGGISFHSFPTDQELREKWTKAMRRLNYKPTNYSKLCGKHFTPDCYETAPWSNMKRLKEGALPTIFEFSSIKKRKYQKKSIEIPQNNSKERLLDEPKGKVQEAALSRSNCRTIVGRREHQMVKIKSLNTRRRTNDLKSTDSESISSDAFVEITEDLYLNESHSSRINIHANKSPSDRVEISPKIISDDRLTSLPTKRIRKKKAFPDDFISENWMSKSQRGARLLIRDDVEIESTITENSKCEATKIKNNALCKTLERNSKTLSSSKHEVKENNDTLQKESWDVSCVRGEENYASEERGGYGCVVLGSKVKLKKDSVLAEMVQHQELPAVSTNSLNSDSICGTNHCTIKGNCANPDETMLGKSEKSSHEDHDSKSPVFCEKAKKFIKSSKGESIDTKASSNNDDQLVNNSERHCEVATDTELSMITCLDILNHQKSSTVNIVEDGEGEMEELVNNSCSSTHSCSVVPVATTFSQKLSSVLKLNLEEEEAILKKTVLLHKDIRKSKFKRSNVSKKVELLKRKEVEDVSKDGQIRISEQNHECSDPSSDEYDTVSSDYFKRKYYVGDFRVEDLVSPEKAAKCLEVAQSVIREKDKRIKYLKQRERRLLKKVEELETVIFHLVERKMNPEEASTVLILLKDND